MRALFIPVQLLDGFANTNDNIRGELLRVFAAAGFEPVHKQSELSTVLGTLAIYSACKPQHEAPRTNAGRPGRQGLAPPRAGRGPSGQRSLPRT